MGFATKFRLSPNTAVILGCSAAALSLIAMNTSVGAATSTRASTTVPGAANCPMFPANNVWNTKINSLPVDQHSASWLAAMDSASTRLHPDFGPSSNPAAPYGIPFVVVAQSHPLVSVRFDYRSESNTGPYPFGASTPIEGGPNSDGDRHAIMVNATSCTLYELYDARYSASGSTAGSGAIWNLKSNALRPANWTSADAAGLPILPGLVTYSQVKSGVITHAIRMTAEKTDASYLWPARHDASTQRNANLPPMGARFRLKADFPLAHFSKDAQVVLRAMQQYGLIVADNGSNWYFQGTADSHWSNDFLDQLKSIPASEFQAVNESSLEVSPNSGAARQLSR